MLAIERHQKIIAHLNAHGSARTMDLADALSVTDETIRRDLDSLSKDKLLAKTHGGAIKIGKQTQDLSLLERQIQNIDEKKQIARSALYLIKANETLFFDASSTVIELAKILPDMPLTIITHSLTVISLLADKPSIKLISTGGSLNKSSRSFTGSHAWKTLEKYHINKMFVSGNGIDLERGVSEISDQEADIKGAALKFADEMIFLADESKLGVKLNFFFANIDEINTLVTNQRPNSKWITACKKIGINIIS